MGPAMLLRLASEIDADEGHEERRAALRLWSMGGGGVLGMLSDVVIVVALVVAVVVGALFVGGRIAPRAENKDTDEVDSEDA